MSSRAIAYASQQTLSQQSQVQSASEGCFYFTLAQDHEFNKTRSFGFNLSLILNIQFMRISLGIGVFARTDQHRAKQDISSGGVSSAHQRKKHPQPMEHHLDAASGMALRRIGSQLR
jgi:hypothetical protein